MLPTGKVPGVSAVGGHHPKFLAALVQVLGDWFFCRWHGGYNELDKWSVLARTAIPVEGFAW
jgi:hypothetical protein